MKSGMDTREKRENLAMWPVFGARLVGVWWESGGSLVGPVGIMNSSKYQNERVLDDSMCLITS